jgi:hypothetical protein
MKAATSAAVEAATTPTVPASAMLGKGWASDRNKENC